MSQNYLLVSRTVPKLLGLFGLFASIYCSPISTNAAVVLGAGQGAQVVMAYATLEGEVWTQVAHCVEAVRIRKSIAHLSSRKLVV